MFDFLATHLVSGTICAHIWGEQFFIHKYYICLSEPLSPANGQETKFSAC